MARLAELHLTAFKSFRDAVLPIHDVTLLVGRNASGKSNALDGLWVLSRLVQGSDIREAVDGGRDGPVVRGGLDGSPPAGSETFTLGCVVEEGEDLFTYELEIGVAPVVQVRSELLREAPSSPSSRRQARDLLTTDPPDPHSGDIVARWNNRKRGTNPPLPMRASQPVLTQIDTRLPPTDAASRRIHEVAGIVRQVLAEVLLLDPVPPEMRAYVPARDTELRRNGANLSAAIADLLQDAKTKQLLLELVRDLLEPDVSDLDVVRTPLGDVMFVLTESSEGRSEQVAAQQMSDGSLRFIALITAVLQLPLRTQEAGVDDATVTLVVEELENGLHPSRAARALRVLMEQARHRSVKLLATTHSTEMLDALDGDAHDDVVVCDRDRQGWSRLTPLPDLDRYLDVVTGGGVGEAAERDQLRPRHGERPDPVEALDAILRAS